VVGDIVSFANLTRESEPHGLFGVLSVVLVVVQVIEVEFSHSGVAPFLNFCNHYTTGRGFCQYKFLIISYKFLMMLQVAGCRLQVIGFNTLML
jgi:hypothetical protein